MSKEFKAVQRDGKIELVPATCCFYCQSPGHAFEQCPEKHDAFCLTHNDAIFLRSVGIAQPFELRGDQWFRDGKPVSLVNGRWQSE
jgi:hypothetical protein